MQGITVLNQNARNTNNEVRLFLKLKKLDYKSQFISNMRNKSISRE